MINGHHFKIIKKIGTGSFGEIFKCEDKNYNIYALKLEKKKSENPQLLNESKIYRILNGEIGFPQIHWYGEYLDCYGILIDCLNESLDYYFQKNNNIFSLKTVLMIADQALRRIQFIHSKGFIHSDIKPANFLIGRGHNRNTIYLIDFGLSFPYKNLQTGLCFPQTDSFSIMGTARFMSINSLLGYTLSRRDDLESLGYVLVYFLKGNLPWQSIASKEEKLNAITKMKIEAKIDNYDRLCDGLPSEFSIFLQRVSSLQFDAEPEYSSYREMFKKLFLKNGFIYDNCYDWS